MLIKALAAVCLAGVALFIQMRAAEYPEAEITNGVLKAKLYLPDAKIGYYRATRFDWSGSISRLEYKGHNYFGVWFPKYDPKLNDSITGPVEEYRTGESALGYDEVKAGGTFIRIGAGVLLKPEEDKFQQFKTYEIVNPGKWIVHTRRDSVEYIHELSDPSTGYGYEYHKTVRLVKGRPEMTIEHSLKNTGKKAIATNVYNHNFFVIDGKPSGPDVTLKFPFAPKTLADVSGKIETKGNELTYVKELPLGESTYTELTGYGAAAADFDIRVENKAAGAGVRVRGDKPLSKMIFWSIRTVVCPEAYVNMEIAPGREFEWKLTYDFYTLKEKGAADKR